MSDLKIIAALGLKLVALAGAMIAGWLWFTMELWSEAICSPVDLVLFRDVRELVECSGYHYTKIRLLSVFFAGMGLVALTVAGLQAIARIMRSHLTSRSR